jgi:hypothetical protein
MKTSIKVIGFAFGIPAAILACFFVYFIAYMSGSIPEGTRYVYGGFTFYTRNGEAYELQIDSPSTANIFIWFKGTAVQASAIGIPDLKTEGFETFGPNSYSTSRNGIRAIAVVSPNGKLNYLNLPRHENITLAFSASPTSPQLQLPISVREVETNFGKPVRKELIYPKIQWR